VASGLHAIATGNRAPSTVVAAGPATLEAAFLEAAGQVADAAGEPVLMVCVDAALPKTYQAFHGVPAEPEQALALLVDYGGAPILSLSWVGSDLPAPPPPGIPVSYRGIRDLLSRGQGNYQFDDGRLRWTWEIGDAAAA
jgi:hypothetical protein